MHILVGGSLRDVSGDPELCQELVRELGREIVRQGHVLVNGCRARSIRSSRPQLLTGLPRPVQKPMAKGEIQRTSSLPTATRTTPSRATSETFGARRCQTGI